MRNTFALLVVLVACADAEDSGEQASTGATTTSSGSTSGTATSTTATTTPGDSGSSGTQPGTSTATGVTTSDLDSSTGESPGTAGCGAPALDPAGEWIAHLLDLEGVMREYWVYLPAPYDPARAYPVVYQFHGCSDGEDRWANNPPVEAQSGADAIHIRGKAVQSCWDTAPQGPDVLFFDALVDEVESSWCADPSRRFVTGYSGGAFMTHVLGCVRADLLRGVASIAGGQMGADCPAAVAALLIHDADDQTVNISASEAARDDHLARNGCDAVAPTTAVEPVPCQAYADCDEGLPVVWCQTAGQGHSRQDELASVAFWGFLSALPDR